MKTVAGATSKEYEDTAPIINTNDVKHLFGGYNDEKDTQEMHYLILYL